MNNHENSRPQEHFSAVQQSEHTKCEVWAERTLDIYLNEQDDDDEVIEHLASCSRCRREFGFWHQFVSNFASTVKGQETGAKEMAHAANGGK